MSTVGFRAESIKVRLPDDGYICLEEKTGEIVVTWNNEEIMKLSAIGARRLAERILALQKEPA